MEQTQNKKFGQPEHWDIFLKYGTLPDEQVLPITEDVRHLSSKVKDEKSKGQLIQVKPGIVKRPDGFYNVRVVRKVSGKRVERKFARIRTLKEAEAILDRLRSEAREVAQAKGLKYATWQSALTAYFDYASNIKSRRTVEDEKRIITSYTAKFLDRPIKSISKSELRSFLRDALATKAIPTRKAVVKMIRNVYSFLIDEGEFNENPLDKYKCWEKEVKRSPNAMNRTETNKLLNEAYRLGHPWADIWYVTYGLGLRSSESAGLMWQDVDLDSASVRIQRQALRCRRDDIVNYLKDKEDRTVPIGSQLLQRLKGLKELASSPFVLPYPKEWGRGEAGKVLRAFQRSVGVRETRFHDLRTAFITHNLILGVAPATVQKMAGHSDLDTTQRYLDKTHVDVSGATDKMLSQAVINREESIHDLGADITSLDFENELKSL